MYRESHFGGTLQFFKLEFSTAYARLPNYEIIQSDAEIGIR